MVGEPFLSAAFLKHCALTTALAVLALLVALNEARGPASHKAIEQLLPIKSQSGSTTLPTTFPADPMPDQFAILERRSIFLRQHVVSKNPSPAINSGAEAGLALRGVVHSEEQFIAFLEETVSHKIMQIRVGDSVCQGRIKSISLNSLEYETSGALVHVQVGQNLQGTMLPPATRPASDSPPVAVVAEPVAAAPEEGGAQPSSDPPVRPPWPLRGGPRGVQAPPPPAQ